MRSTIFKRKQKKKRLGFLQKQNLRSSKKKYPTKGLVYLSFLAIILAFGSWTYLQTISIPSLKLQTFLNFCCQPSNNLEISIKPSDLDPIIKNRVLTIAEKELKSLPDHSFNFLSVLARRIDQKQANIYSATASRVDDRVIQIYIKVLKADVSLRDTLSSYCYDLGKEYIFSGCQILGEQAIFSGFADTLHLQSNENKKKVTDKKISRDIKKGHDLLLLSQRRFGRVLRIHHQADRGISVLFAHPHLDVLFGYDDFTKKLDRLEKIINGLTKEEKKEKLVIELDFHDKAFIRKVESEHKSSAENLRENSTRL